MAQFLYGRTIFCSDYSKNLKLHENIFQQRSHSSSQVHENMSSYYNKSISWGNTSDSMANIEFFLSV